MSPGGRSFSQRLPFRGLTLTQEVGALQHMRLVPPTVPVTVTEALPGRETSGTGQLCLGETSGTV